MVTQYEERDPIVLDEIGGYYSRHVSAMTREALHAKTDIAAELAVRDCIIDELKENCKSITSKHDALVAQRDELLAALEDLKREIILSDVDMDYIDSHFRPWLNKATLAIDNAKGGAA